MTGALSRLPVTHPSAQLLVASVLGQLQPRVVPSCPDAAASSPSSQCVSLPAPVRPQCFPAFCGDRSAGPFCPPCPGSGAHHFFRAAAPLSWEDDGALERQARRACCGGEGGAGHHFRGQSWALASGTVTWTLDSCCSPGDVHAVESCIPVAAPGLTQLHRVPASSSASAVPSPEG